MPSNDMKVTTPLAKIYLRLSPFFKTSEEEVFIVFGCMSFYWNNWNKGSHKYKISIQNKQLFELFNSMQEMLDGWITSNFTSFLTTFKYTRAMGG